MTKNEEVKLAIYENVNIPDEYKIPMIILYEERTNNLDEKDKNVNKVYLDAYKKATSDCKKEIEKINTLISAGKYTEAKMQIVKAKKELKNVEKLVDETPATLTDTALSQVPKMLVNALASFAVQSAIHKLFKDEKKKLADKANSMVDNTKMDDKVKTLAKKQITSSLTDKPTLGGSISDEVTSAVFTNSIAALRGKKPVQNNNDFKKMAKKAIDKENKILDKLAEKVSQLSK